VDKNLRRNLKYIDKSIIKNKEELEKIINSTWPELVRKSEGI
jgi:hypothetical protein